MPPQQLPFSIADRRALVTGGGRGIGRACAMALARAGAEVVVTSRTEGQLAEVVAAIADAGGRAAALPADVGTPDGAASLVAAVQTHWPQGLDILVNNAAVSPYVKGVEQLTDAEWSHVLRVNVDGVLRLVRGLCPGMLQRGRGAVVNVTSVAATAALPRLAAYAASKAALAALTRTMAVEWAARGVRVNAVAPAYIETDMTTEVKKRERLRQWVEGRTPMGRFGQPEEVAWAVVFLASDAASYITGTTVYVDGGWTAS